MFPSSQKGPLKLVTYIPQKKKKLVKLKLVIKEKKIKAKKRKRTICVINHLFLRFL